MSTKKYWLSMDSEDCISEALTKVNRARDGNYDALLDRNARLYYQLDSYYNELTSIQGAGASGEFIRIACNQSRSLIRSLVTLVSSDRLSFECISLANDEKTFSNTRVSQSIVRDLIARKNIDKLQDEAVETALVFGSSFYVGRWNTALGKPWISDGRGKTFFDGDIDICVKSPKEIVFDHEARSWDEVDWVIVRQKMNKHVLASQYRNLKTDLEDLVCSEDDVYKGTFESERNDDIVIVNELYAKPSPAIPHGRLVVFINEDIVLFDDVNPYGCIPVIPNIPMVINRTLKGYAIYSDLLPLQEMLDNNVSAIANNQSAFGVQCITAPNSSNIRADDLGGLRLVTYDNTEGNGKPEPLNLVASAPEMFKMMDVYTSQMQDISGINPVIRGDIGQLTSGIAIATVTANALKFASPFIKSNVIALEKLMELSLKIYKTFAKTERTLAIVGKNGSYINEVFSGSDIEDIQRVKLITRNPMADTMAGRSAIADQLLQSGLIQNPRDYMRVLQTGELEELSDEATTEMDLIGFENDELKEGRMVQAIALDHHEQHLSKHKMLLNNPIIRRDNEVVRIILQHIQEHLNLLRDSEPMILQIAAGKELQVPQPMGQGIPPMNQEPAMPTDEIAEPAQPISVEGM